MKPTDYQVATIQSRLLEASDITENARHKLNGIAQILASMAEARFSAMDEDALHVVASQAFAIEESLEKAQGHISKILDDTSRMDNAS